MVLEYFLSSSAGIQFWCTVPVKSRCFPEDGYCLEYFPSDQSLSAGTECCLSRGGKLASIANANEQGNINNFV